MSSGVLATLHTYYPSFTPVEREIADFILNYGSEVVFMPITELAFRCSVCVTSIVRFCRHLGLEGYQAFRLELSSALEASKYRAPELCSESSDPMERVLDSVYQKYMAALNCTRSMQKSEAFKTIVEHLAVSRQIYFFGVDHSLATAFSACQIALSLLHKGCCAIEPYTQRLQASLLESFDSAIFFSHEGTNEDLLAMASMVKATGTFSVAVTCCGDTPLHKLCSTTLYCGCNADPTTPSQLDFITSKAAVAYIVESLCTACLGVAQTGEEHAPTVPVYKIRH